MKQIQFGFLLLFSSAAIACSAAEDMLIATISTKGGFIEIELFFEKAPLTVSSFAGLATGIFEKETDKIERKGPFFDGLTFHRVVPGFVIQGGDPQGTGTGGPGYSFSDEFHPELVHDSAGILSMANSGPGTNGSQFFITLGPTVHLDNKHSIFGKVKTGMELVETVMKDDIIDSIKISATGSKSKKFLNGLSWEKFQNLEKEMLSAVEKEQDALLEQTISLIEAETPPFTKTDDEIYIMEITKGTGAKVPANTTVRTHYELRLYGEDGIVDSSYSRNSPFEFKAGGGQVIKGWDILVQNMRVGEKIRAIIPPDLGYGARGAGGVIPPNSFLDFTIELVEIVN